MKHIITIPGVVAASLRAHLFQSELEQAAFLFATVRQTNEQLELTAEDLYLVPAEGWDLQHELYLEMKNDERAKIMKLARDHGTAVIDCHSHPGSGRTVRFSPSDLAHLPDFALYVKWKLNGKPFAALVWGEESVDARVWCGDFSQMHLVDEVRIHENPPSVLIPTSMVPPMASRGRKRL